MKTSFTLVYLAAIGLLILTSCSGDDFPKYYKLGTLRVLTLVANNPEVAVGATVTITPVVSDIEGAGRTLTYEASACPDLGVAFGAEPTCEGNPLKVSLGTGNVTGLAGPNYTGATNTFNVTVPATTLLGRTTADQYNGVAYLFVYKVTAPDGTNVRAFRRIIASSRATKNTNPTLTQILSNGSALAALPAGDVSLSADYTAGSIESYQVQLSDGTLNSKAESLTTTWFVSDGKVQYTRTIGGESTKFTPPSAAPAGRNVLVIGVIRDARGGVSYSIATL